MHKLAAIRFTNVSKVYKLHGSKVEQLIDALGLYRLGIKTKLPSKEFVALNGISLEVPRGRRVGIVGRNGAGKTTLLKLICGNHSPSFGDIEVNGLVQALMNVGLGFHPEFTGRENIESSLLYNGLTKKSYNDALEDIINFCELGEFIDQPFKTYSLGMQARLMFATSTAINPDILIIDEVLGAGDAYFVAKSKTRVEKLVRSGCTMLLVSHSMQQILELCDEVIWLDKGSIRMQGEAFLVVKAYEEYLYGAIEKKDDSGDISTDMKKKYKDSINKIELNLKKELDFKSIDQSCQSALNTTLLQEPFFMPHKKEIDLIKFAEFPTIMKFVAPGGISRWAGSDGIKISGFTMCTEQGETNKLVSLRPAKIMFTLNCEAEGRYNCRYGIAIHNSIGKCVLKIFSPSDNFQLSLGASRVISIIFNPLQLGAGEYFIGISVSEYSELELIDRSNRIDLLNRSFHFFVEVPDTLKSVSAEFFHTAEWGFS